MTTLQEIKNETLETLTKSGLAVAFDKFMELCYDNECDTSLYAGLLQAAVDAKNENGFKDSINSYQG
jgi:hypothetical protein